MRKLGDITESLNAPGLLSGDILFVENINNKWCAYRSYPIWQDQNGGQYRRMIDSSCGGTTVYKGPDGYVYTTPWGTFIYSILGVVPGGDSRYWEGSPLVFQGDARTNTFSAGGKAENDIVLSPKFPRWEYENGQINAPWGFYSAVSGSGVSPTRILIGNPVFVDQDKREYQLLEWGSNHLYSGGLSFYGGTISKWVIGTPGAVGGWWESSGEPDPFGSSQTFKFKKNSNDQSPALPNKTLGYSYSKPVLKTAYAGYYPLWH